MNKPIYLVITTFFPSPTRWDGSYCYDFVKALVANGKFDVRVFVTGDGRDYEYHGIRVHTFKVRALPSNVLPFLFHRHNERVFLGKVKEVLGSAATDQSSTKVTPRVVIAHAHTARCAIYALAAKRVYGCQTLLHHHDPQSFGLGLGVLKHCGFYNLYLFRALRKLHEQIDCHVFISSMVKRSFLMAPDASWTTYRNYRQQMRGPKFCRCRPVRIHESIILHNGVDTTVFHPIEKKVDNSTVNLDLISRPKFFTIGCIGNYIDWKDHITLLRALVKLKDKIPGLRCRMIGSESGIVACRRFVEENGLSNVVEFMDLVQHDQLPDIFRSFDLFVLPSYFEGFGCVFTEAYACGVPFITCEGQGIADMLQDNAWLIKPHDSVGLAERITSYYGTRPRQRLIGEIALQPLVDNFVKELENKGVGL